MWNLADYLLTSHNSNSMALGHFYIGKMETLAKINLFSREQPKPLTTIDLFSWERRKSWQQLIFLAGSNGNLSREQRKP
jgi:hypothetical protein